jgi:hypothetical protein
MSAVLASPTDYYTRQAPRLLRALSKSAPAFRAGLEEHVPPEVAEAVWQATAREFGALIPRLPYIGGRANPLTENLIVSGWFLSLFRAWQAAGQPESALGAVTLSIARAMFARQPRLAHVVQGALARTPLVHILFRRLAARSQQRAYPADFVVEHVPASPSGEFDFGFNFRECGICKLFQAEGADGLTRHMCQIDYVGSALNGLALTRTGTIAEGADHCDFRFKRQA